LSEVFLAGNSTILANTIAIGTASGTSDLILNGAVTLNGAGIFTTGNLTLNGQLSLAADATLSLGGVTTVTQPIVGTSQLFKSGSGTLKISNRSFAGLLAVESGEVELLSGLSGLVTLGGGTLRAASVLDSGLNTDGNGGSLIFGTTTAILQSAGDVRLDENTNISIELNGTTPGTGHDQLRVTGADRSVLLDNATLALTIGFTAALGSNVTLIELVDPTSTLSGRFAGLDEDAVVKIGNQSFAISYFGGDGNDVVLTAISTVDLDLGGAPDSYGTQLADDGARHIAIGPALGARRSIDDGLVSHSIVFGHASELIVMVQNAPTGAKLDAWVDWNLDGTFTDNERIAVGLSVLNGLSMIPFDAPEEIAIGEMYARLRLSTAGVNGPVGLADDGEVEDYLITVQDFNNAPTIGTPVAVSISEDLDSNGVGVVDVQSVVLIGISGGLDEASQLTRVSATTDNSDLISQLSVQFSEGANQGSLTFVPGQDLNGQATIAVTVRDTGLDGLFGAEDDGIVTTSFRVNVLPVNDAPTLSLATPTLELDENAGVQLLLLDGIASGGKESQNLVVTVSSDNPSLFKTLKVNYEQGSTFGTLELETAANKRGTSKLTITVDDGALRTSQVVDVAVRERNDLPTVNPIAAVVVDMGTTERIVSLTGISAGGSETQDVELTAFSYGSTLITDIVVDRSGNSSAANLKLKFAPEASGSETVSVRLRDAGINAINRGEGGDLSSRVRTNEPYYDVNGDDLLSPLDVLVVINAINRDGDGEWEEARQAELEISQAVAAIGRATQQDSQTGQVWSDLNWLWQEQDDVYGPKKGRVR